MTLYMNPMLLTAQKEPFSDENYIFEPKLNGQRLIVSLDQKQLRLYSRHQYDCTRQYPELYYVPVDDDVVLDGEVVQYDEEGRIDFPGLMTRYRLTKPGAIRAAAASNPVQYLAFDILSYKGEDLRGLSLLERKRILDEVLTENRYYAKMKHIDKEGEALYRVMQESGLEGIVGKLKTSTYLEGTSPAWISIDIANTPKEPVDKRLIIC